MKDLKEVNYLFSTIPSVKVILIAGNHDRIRENSALLSFTWSPNVTFIMDEDLTSVYLRILTRRSMDSAIIRLKSSRPCWRIYRFP